MYRNGEVPFSALIHIVGNIWLPPGTAARFAWVFDLAFQKYGIRLRFTPDRDGLGGWNGYRPYSAQVLYRNHYGIGAAVPRYSTHGGNVGGREVFAGDVDNWAELGWARFAALCRLAGLTVDFVKPQELWHVGDYNNPWAVPSFASAGGSGSALNPGSTTTLIVHEEDDDMPKNAAICTTANDKPISEANPADVYAIVNTGSGYFSPVMGLSGNPGATDLVRAFDIGGPVTWVTKSHFNRIQADCALVRTGKG